MEAQTKVAKQRLSVLELANKLGNVSEACRRRGMDRITSTIFRTFAERLTRSSW